MGRSYRSLAMGNTGVASANDSAALYYNPAVLGNARGWWLDYSAWTVEYSEGFAPPEVGLVLISPRFPYISREGLRDELKNAFLDRENPFLRGSAGMTFVANIDEKGWSIAASYLIETIITTKESGNIIFQRSDITKKIGLSIPLGLGQIVLGIARSDTSRNVSSEASTDTIPSWKGEYRGVGYDIGLLYRMAGQAHMTWGLVVYNYGGTTYDEESELVDPQSYAMGLSSSHEFGFFKLVTALDIREIASSTDPKNTVHAGLEVGMFPNDTGGSYLSYRLGYNRGYASRGVELNLFNHSMVMGYASYIEEMGTAETKAPSQRTVFYFSMGF